MSAPRLLVDGAVTGPGAVVAEGGQIVEVLDHVPADVDVALDSGLLSPGLVDVQINGFAGVDFASAGTAEWDAVDRALPATGVTSYVATFITAPVEDLADALSRASSRRSDGPVEGGARLIGAHVEGPFLSPLYRGAHDATLMRDPSPEALDVLLASAGSDALVILTLAPEREHALDAIKRLVAAGVVVSIGHTDATGAQVAAAADAGAGMVTHLFNAQRPLGHREPGVAGQGMADDRLVVGLIPDLQHVSAPIVRVVMRACAGRAVLVTDAVAAAGMPPGRYELGGADLLVSDDGTLPRRADGTIAGSVLTLDEGVRNVVAQGIDIAAALDAATRVPADLVRRPDLGRLAAGTRADLVWFDDDLRVRRTWVAGRAVFDRSQA
ncbi:MAG TPA: N-acetylglucosamine-6-phosphate deacetylase [Candidatus Nanopelagicales bacterium]|nr:N-acetylglucosamine-6-phosphate deacetylase [Candidatus Nanopelagicales bacterium]